jgi:hypothetical protein
VEDYVDIASKDTTKTAPKLGAWSKMNYIQRIGCLGLFPYMILSFVYSGRLGIIFGLMGWTSIFLGYVAGNLWRFRHALHFWWSVTFACAVHTALLPVYARLVNQIKNAPHHEGKGYMYLTFGVLIVEVLTLLYTLKNIGLWLRRRSHKLQQIGEPH